MRECVSLDEKAREIEERLQNVIVEWVKRRLRGEGVAGGIPIK